MRQRTLRTGVALHARPLDRFVRRAREVQGRVALRFGSKQADGRNVTQLLLLAVPRGAEVSLEVESPDESEALEVLAALLEGEEPVAAAPPAPASPAPQPRAGLLPGVLAGAPGRAVGRAHRPGRLGPARPTGSVDEEQLRLEAALEAARAATLRLIGPDDPFSDIFEAQLTILEDPALRDSLRASLAPERSAEEAIGEAFAELARSFQALGTGFAAERHADIADLRERLLASLGSGDAALAGGERLVLVLEEATPSRIALLDTERVAAVVSERGGPTSHAAVVARGRGVPLVFVSGATLVGIEEGELLLVDGTLGRLRRATAADGAVAGPSLAASPGAATADGVPVCLRANLGAPGDLAMAKRWGAEGSGLLRSELLFAGWERAPSRDEQAQAYSRLARALAPHPIVVRLFDAGSDKPLAFLPALGEEPNPALGHRGVRLLLEHERVLAEQLAAIAQARRESGCDLKAMVPMLTDGAELEAVRSCCPPGLPLGAMIETPAAAILAGSLARRAAFFSVGTNDLMQYVTASDRQRAGAPLHPSVLRLLASVVREADAAGIECSICGELAGDPQVAPLLIGLGYRSLSLAPAQLPAVREALARWGLAELRGVAADALACEDGGSLAAFVAERFSSSGGESE